MYDVMTIAKYILYYYHNRNISITSLKLQKLLYLIQLECLIELKELCFYDKIEAWSHGPAIPKIYYEYYRHSYHHIPAVDIAVQEISPDFKKCIDAILTKYETVKDFDIVRETIGHYAWQHSYRKNERNEITVDMLKAQTQSNSDSVKVVL